MQNGKVEIQLDRKRYLKFNFNAWCAVEEAAGSSLRDCPNPLVLGIRGERAMLYGGLIHEDPSLTIRQVGEFFDDFDKVLLIKKVKEALDAANPNQKAEAVSPNARGLVDGTGTNSIEQPLESD